MIAANIDSLMQEYPRFVKLPSHLLCPIVVERQGPLMKLVAMLWLMCCAVFAQASDDVMRMRLQDAVTAVRQARDLQGVAAGVVTPSGRWTVCAGASHEGEPIRPDMVFGIGSNTKTLTALLFLRLQERGVVQLDERIGGRVPSHPFIDTSITIRQLLQHTSGLGEFAGGQAYRDSILSDPQRVWTSDELVAMIPAPQFAPGTSWRYCNSNYLLAGIIAERVGQAPYHTLLQQEVLERANVDSTVVVPYQPIEGVFAHRWLGGRDAASVPMQAEWSGAWAAGAVVSTAGQMAALYDALFGGRIIDATSMDQMLAVTGPNDYGLGISAKTIGGRAIYGHSGEIRGYTSVMMWVPSLRASITVLVNEADADPVAVADTIIRVLSATPTSVDEGTVPADLPTFPSDVWSIHGGAIGTIASAQMMASLPTGAYVLRSNDRMHHVLVLPDGSMGFAKASHRFDGS